MSYIRPFPVMILGVLLLSCAGRYTVAVFDAGSGRTVEVLADRDWEVSQGFYYQVKADGEITVPATGICAGQANDTVRFKMLAARGGSLVGIYVEKHPETILALHDFGSGFTWPRTPVSESGWDHGTRADKLLDEVRREQPGVKLMLGNSGCR